MATDSSSATSASASSSSSDIVELNVGGVVYTTTRSTLTFDGNSVLATILAAADQPAAHHHNRHRSAPGPSSSSTAAAASVEIVRDSKGRMFIDRDGVLFRYVLDYLRNKGQLVLPENFCETARLRLEAEYFQLTNLATALKAGSPPSPNNDSGGGVVAAGGMAPLVGGDINMDNLLNNNINAVVGVAENELPVAFITIGYRGTFFSGPESTMRGAGLGDIKDVKFRKLSRILVCGRVVVCREIFGDTLNESRDPDRGHTERYSSRFFLKHNHLEAAFEALACTRFRLVTCCSSGTSAASGPEKPGIDHEESRWQHYSSYVFQRP